MGANIFGMTDKGCGKKNIPGYTTTGWVTSASELKNGMPKTKAALGGTEKGDTKIYDEPFDFSGADVGFGYWRPFKMKVKTGMNEDLLEGEIGSKEFANQCEFEIIGDDAEKREWSDNMVEIDGCAIFMFKDKNGKYPVIGTTDNPCEILAGSKVTSGKASGDSRGAVFQARAETGVTSPFYDADTHGIDETPN